MSGKFLKPAAIADVIKSRERTNSIRKREGLMQHPVRFYVCGCSDECCGGWHSILTDYTIPTADQCVEILREHNNARKSRKRGQKRAAAPGSPS